MSKKILILCIFLLGFRELYSQTDFHSQYYCNELQQNPALTGLMESKWRLRYFRRYLNFESFRENKNTLFFDMKFMINKKFGEYGFNLKDFSGWMLGVGFMDSRKTFGTESGKIASEYLTLSFHRQLKSSNYLSFGLQPGYEKTNNQGKFNMNAGIMFGSKKISCWTEDQFFKIQAGISVYNIFTSNVKNDTLSAQTRYVQLHAGYLIKAPEHLNIYANAALWHDTVTSFSAGTNVLFFPIVHYRFYDRARLGIHFRSSNHLVLSGGLRFYGARQKSISIDVTASYDAGLSFIGLKTWYKNGFEFGIVLTPLQKCWSLSKC